MFSGKHLASLLKKLRHKQTMITVITIGLIVLSIPLTLVVLKEEQDIRQEAANNTTSVISIAASSLPQQKYAPGILSVKFKNRAGASAQSIALIEDRISQRFDAQVTRHDDIGLSEVLVAPGEEDQIIAELKKDPNVERANRSAAVYALGEPNDTDFSKQYGLSQIQAPAAWDVTEGSEDVVIAIIDSGIDEDHPDLKSKIVPGSKVYHSYSDSVEDTHGHGTHVAGIAAAITNNNKGVAGVCPKCKILNVKVLDTKNSQSGKPEGSGVDAAKGIRYAADQGAKVLNMSFAFQVDDPDVRDAIDYAYSKGAVLIAGAGNNGSTGNIWPAAYNDKVIAVGSVGKSDKKSSFSNYGKYVDVAAPGEDIWSTYKDSQLANMSGTSMSSPFVAGLAGLLASEGLSAQQIRSKIESSADDTPGTGSDWQKGRINAVKALGGKIPDPKPTKPSKDDDDDKDKKDKTPKPKDDPEPCETPSDNNKNTPDRKNTKNKKNTKVGGDIRERVNSIRQQILQRVQNIRRQLGGRGASIQSSPDDCDRNREESGRTRTPNRQNPSDGEREVSIVTPGQRRVVTIHIREETPGRIKIGDKEYTTDEYNELFGNDNDNDNEDQTGNDRNTDRDCIPARITMGEVGGTVTIKNGCEESSTSSVSIIEYNLLMDCYSDNVPPRRCDATKKAQADLNGDGQVNAIDYNIFLKEMATKR